MIVQTLKIILEELNITEFEYIQFNQGIKEPSMQAAFYNIKKPLFEEEASSPARETKE